MLFPTLQFALFLLILLGLMFVFRRSGPRKLLLLLASWVFYMAWNPAFIWLLLSTSMVDYWAAGQMHRSDDPRRRKLLLVLSLGFNLGLLSYFKYAGFLSGSLLYLFRTAGIPVDWHIWAITLPVGISFYTFQSMSYTIDVYRKQLAPAASVLDYMLFVAFFPHLVAGPIVRAIDLLPQLARPVQLRCDAQAIVLIASGLVKKVVVADNLAPFVDAIMHAPAQQTSLALWLSTIGFGVQVYCDFSGYSEIAIGIARLFGYWLPDNWNRPLTATNPRDFWLRDHISLSTWLRDYLFIPLGGSRHGELMTTRNILITMLLGGLWHGASWGFVAWGGWHALMLIGHRQYSRLLRHAPQLMAWGTSPLGRFLSWAAFGYLLLISWFMFRIQRAPDLLAALHKFFVLDGQWRLETPATVDWMLALALLACFWALHVVERFAGLKTRLVQRRPGWAWAYAAVCVLLLAVFWPSHSAPFIYFQF